MFGSSRIDRYARRGAATLAIGALIAGCGSSSTSQTTSSKAASGGSSHVAGSGSSMPGMNMAGTTSTAGMIVNGIKPVASQPLASAQWEGMSVQARTMTPVPYVTFSGTKEQLIKPPAGTSFHLMIMLSDAHTGVAIPYASVWATIHKAGKLIYDEPMIPMLSAYMGPHYGNNVALPGAGTYQLTLLISPPMVARHIEYQNVWLKPHRVTVSFHWAAMS